MTKGKEQRGSNNGKAGNKDRGLRPTTSDTPMPAVKPPKPEGTTKQS